MNLGIWRILVIGVFASLLLLGGCDKGDNDAGGAVEAVEAAEPADSGVAAAAVGLALPTDAAAQESDGELKRFILIGLCEPTDDSPETLEGFREFFVDQHVEDVSKTPNFVRSRVYELRGKHLEGATFTDFISFYEVDATSWEEAERVLNEWQRDPDAWEGRAHHMETGKRVGNVLSCPGSGWYEMLRTHDGPAKAASKLE